MDEALLGPEQTVISGNYYQQASHRIMRYAFTYSAEGLISVSTSKEDTHVTITVAGRELYSSEYRSTRARRNM
jgi:hypothetical protein